MNIDEKMAELCEEIEKVDSRVEDAKAIADAKIATIRAELAEETKAIKAEKANKVKALKKLEGIKAQLESLC